MEFFLPFFFLKTISLLHFSLYISLFFATLYSTISTFVFHQQSPWPVLRIKKHKKGTSNERVLQINCYMFAAYCIGFLSFKLIPFQSGKAREKGSFFFLLFIHAPQISMRDLKAIPSITKQE